MEREPKPRSIRVDCTKHGFIGIVDESKLEKVKEYHQKLGGCDGVLYVTPQGEHKITIVKIKHENE